MNFAEPTLVPSCRSTTAVTTVLSATTEPTDKSIPPETTTMVMPSAATHTITVCRGNYLRFRAIGGRYQISIRGTGIYLSAVGHGYAILNGAGDDSAVQSDGAYSLNDAPYKSLPDFGATVDLVAPVAG